ncbi:MAG: hypothetical protein FJX22_00270 [Alphaproteobacteria bacterium]|nr:hypothetical protein [Alphaproteobacteria bacterium]
MSMLPASDTLSATTNTLAGNPLAGNPLAGNPMTGAPSDQSMQDANAAMVGMNPLSLNSPKADPHDDAWLAEEAALLAQVDASAIEKTANAEEFNPANFVLAASRPTVVNLKKNFRILAHRPLPQFDTPSAKAFEALHVRDRERAYYALISDTRLPPRLNMLFGLGNQGVQGLVCPRDWGVVEWLGGRLCYAIVMEQPGSRRLMRDLSDTFAPISDKMVSRTLLAPAFAMLSALAARGYTHRALRLSNMFLSEGHDSTVVFGECYSKPAAYDQPAVFEPVESALCHPLGRGEGGIGDDIYALGVCLAILLNGYNPLNGLSAEQIIDRKLTMGSLNAMMGNARISPMMMEPLKGMLADSHKSRWSLRDLDNWLNGRQSLSHTSVSRPKAARAFQFLGEPYLSLPHLASALGRNWAPAVEEVVKKPMALWLRRSMNDEEKAESFEKLMMQPKFDDATGNDVILSRACNIFYPDGPIFYKGMTFLPDGLKNLLLLSHEDITITTAIHDVIEKRILSYWMARQGHLPLQYTNTLESINGWRKFLNTHGLGFGIERCLYEANPGMLCLSPLVFRYAATDLSSLMKVLDEIAANQPDLTQWQWDTHLAGFILANLQNNGLGFAKMINLEDPAQKRLGWLGLLALVQQKKRLGGLPNLAAALYPWLAPILDLYHSRSRQSRIREELEKAAKSGSLVSMMAILQNYVEILNDKNGFYRARYEYTMLKVKQDEMAMNNQKKMEYNLPIGQNIVAFVAGATAATFLVGVVYKEFAWRFF